MDGLQCPAGRGGALRPSEGIGRSHQPPNRPELLSRTHPCLPAGLGLSKPARKAKRASPAHQPNSAEQIKFLKLLHSIPLFVSSLFSTYWRTLLCSPAVRGDTGWAAGPQCPTTSFRSPGHWDEGPGQTLLPLGFRAQRHADTRNSPEPRTSPWQAGDPQTLGLLTEPLAARPLRCSLAARLPGSCNDTRLSSSQLSVP